MNGVAVIDRLTIDCIYSDFKEFPKKGEEIYTKGFSVSLGGGACVIPIKLSSMGVPARFGTFLGNDDLSNTARNLLGKTGFSEIHNFYSGSKVPVIYSTIFSSSDDRGILSYDEGINEEILSDDEIYKFFKGARICFAPKRTEVVKKLHDDGAIIVYDSHWEEGQSIFDYIPILQYADFFTPNDKEAMALTDTDNAEDALSVLSEYTKNPIVKTGKDGCIAKINDEIIHFPTLKTEAVDTTGAGDNFLAGLTFGIYHNLPVEKCIALANIAGALSTTAYGCYNAQYDLNDYLKRDEI